ncbi:MAG: cytochrome C assembly protein [Pirellulaceae bacterium]|nr:cytochrome C assembly protein [Pirellulaceae bacterium]
MLQGITITCFAASYAVVLLLEASRLLFRLPVRMAVILGCTVAGLVAHTAYLWTLASGELLKAGVAPLSNWYDWCLLAAWVLALACLGLTVRRPQVSVGLFLMPLVLALIGVAYVLRDAPAFSRGTALLTWRSVHGLALMLGTVGVLLGAATGVMYLIQSYRLKHKLPPRRGFKLPSLEWLQRFNKRSLAISAGLMAAGLLSGIVLNLLNRGQPSGTVAWTDLGVLSSGVLFAWLTLAVLLETFYRPASQGRKVALLTLASFVFLVLALGFVLLGDHASREAPETSWQTVPAEPWARRSGP